MSQDDLERRIRRLEDLEEIRKLKARYCAYCDDGYDADGLASIFAEDAVWDGGPLGRCEGREAIREFFREAPSRISFAIHHVTNPIIDVDGDTATGRWRIFQPCTIAAGNQALWLAGEYRDRYVRTADGWKFKHVEIELSFVSPFEDGWSRTPFISL